jgi:hypothetical protein
MGPSTRLHAAINSRIARDRFASSAPQKLLANSNTRRCRMQPRSPASSSPPRPWSPNCRRKSRPCPAAAAEWAGWTTDPDRSAQMTRRARRKPRPFLLALVRDASNRAAATASSSLHAGKIENLSFGPLASLLFEPRGAREPMSGLLPAVRVAHELNERPPRRG